MPQDAGEVSVNTELPKESIEHLRTVHFTLVAVSLALFVLATSSKKSVISSARNELASIIQLSRNWRDDWITREFERGPVRSMVARSSGFGPSSTQKAIQFQAKGNKYFVALDFSGHNWIINTKDDALEVQFGEHAPASLVKRPSTLEEFHLLWDDLGKELLIKIPTEIENHPIVLFQSENVGKSALPAGFTEKSSKYPTIDLELAASIRQLGLPKEKGMFYGGVENIENFGVVTVALPITSDQSFPFDGQAPLIAQYPQWRHGTFAHSFVALYGITRDYEALDLETIDRILSAEENRTSESFEAVGMKFPAEVTTRWGMFLVIGIQIYLWLHLYELPPGLVKENQSHIGAWIGLYRSRYARIAYFASTVLLPVTSIVVLIFRPWYLYGIKEPVQLAIGALCVVGTAVLGWLSWKLSLSRLRGF